MIVTRLPGALRLVRQVDHARQCAELADAWGGDPFTRLPHWGALREAARVHDEGWRDEDEHPTPDARGRPVDFPDLPRPTHAAMFGDGVLRAVRRGPRVGLLVSMHGQGLYEKRLGLDGAPPPRDTRPSHERAFLAQQDAVQARMRSALRDPEDGAWAWAAFRLLQAWDTLSLFLCWGVRDSGDTWRLPQVPRAVGDPGVGVEVRSVDGVCLLHPWPFASGEVRTAVPARTVEDVPHDRASLRRALDAAPVGTVSAVLRPAEPCHRRVGEGCPVARRAVRRG